MTFALGEESISGHSRYPQYTDTESFAEIQQGGPIHAQ